MIVTAPGCAAPAVQANSADQVVKSFYDWYLAYEGNPLVMKAYQTRTAELTAEFVGKVDDILASFERGGHDPFLVRAG